MIARTQDAFNHILRSLWIQGLEVKSSMGRCRCLPIPEATEVLGMLNQLATATAQARARTQELADEYRGHTAPDDPDPPGAGEQPTD